MTAAARLAIELWSNEIARKVREMTTRERFRSAMGDDTLTCRQIADRLRMSPELTRYHLKRLGIEPVDTTTTGSFKPARLYSLQSKSGGTCSPSTMACSSTTATASGSTPSGSGAGTLNTRR